MSDTSEPASTQDDQGEVPKEDVRERFRQALERKQAKAKSGENHADGSSKIHDSHGPASNKRTFRRKSG